MPCFTFVLQFDWGIIISISIRVLVVDDFVPWRNYIVAKLAENPALHIVGFASDGLEAVQKAAELQPELILMDINLPNLSGISAARRIQELSLKTKILFVSQNVDLDVVRAALDAGGSGYVLKSSAESELLGAVEAVMLGKTFVSDQLATRDFSHAACAQVSIQSPFEESIESAMPPLPVDKTFGHCHEVEFYRNDASFLERCARFMGTALANGDSVILGATPSHAKALRQGLESEGCDVAEAIERGRYLVLEPACVLSEFLVNDQPDSARFTRTVTNLFETALKAASGNHPRVAACGECSALLYAEGKAEAAVEIERLFDEFARANDVDVLCGYPMEGFRSEEERSIFQRICAAHSSVYAR
ncbi:MAG: response regulator [Candidatus Acidiferrales bacterium]